MHSIRWMVPSQYGEAVAMDPLMTDGYLQELRIRKKSVILAYEDWGALAAYGCYLLERDCIELCYLYVRPDFRRRGIGRNFLLKLKDKVLASQKQNELRILVRHDYLDVQKFLAACGCVAEPFSKDDILFSWFPITVAD